VTTKYRRGKIILLCGVFLVMTGLGITLPVLPFYIEKLLPSGSASSNTVSLHVGLITGAFPLTQFLPSPRARMPRRPNEVGFSCAADK